MFFRMLHVSIVYVVINLIDVYSKIVGLQSRIYEGEGFYREKVQNSFLYYQGNNFGILERGFTLFQLLKKRVRNKIIFSTFLFRFLYLRKLIIDSYFVSNILKQIFSKFGILSIETMILYLIILKNQLGLRDNELEMEIIQVLRKSRRLETIDRRDTSKQRNQRKVIFGTI